MFHRTLRLLVPPQSSKLRCAQFWLGMAALTCLPSELQASDDLFVAKPVTALKSFTEGIEGPAADSAGNVYVVNFEKQQTIGKITPSGETTLWVTLPGSSVGNGIRFDQNGIMFVADYVGHNVLRIDPQTKQITVHAHSADMNQPNDLAIMKDGTLFASDPDWANDKGQLWRIDTDGSVHRLAHDMGTTNGIEVSPDEKTLYVNESVQRNVWAFDITSEKQLTNKRLIRQFPDHGFDGMRCDRHGNLYITRYGKGTVVVMTPAGEILREIDVLGPRPSNLTFAGPNQNLVYVTEVEHQRVVMFAVE